MRRICLPCPNIRTGKRKTGHLEILQYSEVPRSASVLSRRLVLQRPDVSDDFAAQALLISVRRARRTLGLANNDSASGSK